MMAGKRKAVAVDVHRQVLHEAGYKCGNPTCHRILTLDIHHIVEVEVGGPNELHNLLALCPNCHALHHRQKVIPIESIRAWKMLLLAINEAYDRRSVDILLALDKTGDLFVSGDGVLMCAALVAGGLVFSHQHVVSVSQPPLTYRIGMTARAKSFVEAWKREIKRPRLTSSTKLSAGNQRLAGENDCNCARTLRPSEVSSYHAEPAFRTLRTRPRFSKFFHAERCSIP
jgi:hypothetical protein